MKPIEYLHIVSQSVFVAEINESRLNAIVAMLRIAGRNRSTVWIAGNGGSAATASHFANDLSKMCGINAISISDQTPTILAYGNDNGWEFMFSDCLSKRMQPGDILVAISCSGRSPNILNAAQETIRRHGKVIALTGMERDNMLVAMQPDQYICIDSPDIKIQEDIHMVMCHAIAGALA